MSVVLSKFFRCRACGLEVVWCESKAGKKYLAQPRVWEGEFASRTYYPFHQCAPVEGWQEQAAEREAARIEAAIASGRVEKGVPVIVVKGRKVAIGTTGVVFWVADEPNGYGVVTAGFTTEAGDKHFTNVKNLEVRKP